jgi:NAD(P)-dependent dehydrogenase (short-subunit alcohol dehydrogenase family)
MGTRLDDVPTTTDLDGEVALVSGGTAGIGKATATRLAERGATVVLVGSTRERGETAVAAVTAATGNDDVTYLQADLARMAAVRELAATVRGEYDRLDTLVHTAGIVPSEREMTDEGVERSFAINYLSRFLLTTLLQDRLVESAPARIVIAAAAGQNSVDELDLDDLSGERLFRDPEESGYMVRGLGMLNQAQVANDLFAVELAERLAGSGVSVSVVDPGAVDTDIRVKADSEGWHELDEMLRSEMGVVAPETVAETTMPLATVTEPASGNGRFFQTGRTAVEIPEGVRDPDLRQRLWERSHELASRASGTDQEGA